MTTSLDQFQERFAAALFANDPTADPDSSIPTYWIAQPGFNVYRNTVMKGSIDALQANFPAVTRLVGDEWFRAAAACHVRECPPRSPMLIEYGEKFADFLAAFEPARELPYLPQVARLDRLWTEVHVASDEPRLDGSSLASLAPDILASARLVPCAAARWAWFDEVPAYTIWRRNRDSHELPNDASSMKAAFDESAELEWRSEGALLVRTGGGEIRWRPLSIGEHAFLDACAAGKTIESAATTALERESALDFARLAGELLRLGTFTRLEFPLQGESQ